MICGTRYGDCGGGGGGCLCWFGGDGLVCAGDDVDYGDFMVGDYRSVTAIGDD